MSRFVHTQIVRIRQFAGHILPRRVLQIDGGAIFAMLVIVGFVFTLSGVEAIDLSGEGLVQWVSWMLFSIANLFIALTVFCLRFFITLASYNNYIDVPIVKLGWAMVRDVANMFFVVALLVIAFATILGYEQYEWKRGMVKLVLMAIFINFSNLIAQLVIDVAHVFTMTFLNAISATAGGNLINMFNLDKVASMVTGAEPWKNVQGATTTIFATGVFAVLYSVMALISIGSYAIVMAFRVVVLWALIILSPLAYVLYAMPKGEKYAQEWWSEFSKHVIVAPIMVFFLWLSFATLGAGNVISDIQENMPQQHHIQTGEQTLSLAMSEVSTWERFANFLVAFAFLMIGLRKTQETGAEGAGLVSGATSFGKKVATIATGYAAGRWLVGKGADGGKFGLKKAAYHMPLGGKFWKTTGTNIAGRAGAKYGLYKEKRETKYAAYEKAHPRLKYGKRLLGIATGGLMGESASRRAKRAADWKDTAERQKAIYEESYSTSSTSGGQAKIRVTARKKLQEQMIAEKKEKKIELEVKEILKAGSDRQGSEYDSARRFVDIAASERAERRDLRKEKEVTDAEAEANVLRSKGKHVEAAAIVESVYKKHQKEEQEVYESMDHNPRIFTSKDIATKLAGAGTDAEKANIRKDAVKLLNVAAKDGKEQFEEMIDTMIEQIYGSKQEITAENMGQRILEASTGRRISSQQEFHDAHKLLEENNTFRNAEDSQAALASLAGSLKMQAKEGGMRSVGAVIEDAGGSNDGADLNGDHIAGKTIAYRLASHDFGAPPAAGAVLTRAQQQVQTDQQKKIGTEQYFEARADLKAATDLHGFMNVKDGKVTGVTSRQKEQLKTALGAFGDERAVSTGFNNNISKKNKLSNFDGIDAQEQVAEMLVELGADYAAQGKQNVYNQILNTQFPEWVGNMFGRHRVRTL